jgi:FAD/FMN-containing dehydrogenase
MTDVADHPALDRLAATFGDRLTFPGHAGWDAVRSPWNLSVDQHPAAVAAPADLDELRALLAAARADGLRLAVQPGGHGASGTVDGSSVLVRTAAFDHLDVDVDARVARIGAGLPWGRVLAALAGTGLVAMAGSSPIVNATAFTLSGGQSWFARSHGHASSSLRAIELLTADGRHRWLRDADEPELLWASRGAGGAFGIVTAIEIDLHPAPVITGGRLDFAPSDVTTVLRAVVDAGSEAPDTMAVHAGVLRIPDVPQAPPELRGRTVLTAQFVELGASDEARAVIDRVRAAGTVVADTIGPISVEGVGDIAGEPTERSTDSSWSALADLDAEAIDRLVEAWRSPEGQEVIALGFRVLGGALAAPPRRPGIAGAVRESHLVTAHAMGLPGRDEAAARSFAAMREALGLAASDRTFCTFLGPGDGYVGAYARSDVARAAAVKATIDPEDRFRGNRDFT